MRVFAVLLLAPAIACAQNWNDLLKKGAEAAAQEIKKQQAQKPAPAKPASAPSSPTPATQPVAQAKPAPVASEAISPMAATGELLPLRRLPLFTGEMGVNLIVEVDGTVKAWGDPQGDGTYVGNGTTNEVLEPETLPGVTDIVDASVAPGHALILRRDGIVLTWGRNRSCELTVKDDRKRLSPFPVPGLRNVVKVFASHMFSAAILRDGTMMAWGSNEGGFLANGKSGWGEPCALLPVPVEGVTGVKKVVISNSVLVLKDDGTVWGWGPNKNGELCDGTTEKRARPVQMKGIANAIDIDADHDSAIVLADGTVWKCGSNAYAEMAKKQEMESVKYTLPVQIPGIAGAVAVRTSGATLVRLKDGTLLGWGSGIFGALGNGRIEGDFPKPTAPIGLGPVIEHGWMSNSAYALKADGTLMRWAFYVGKGGKEWQLTPVAWRKMTLAPQP